MWTHTLDETICFLFDLQFKRYTMKLRLTFIWVYQKNHSGSHVIYEFWRDTDVYCSHLSTGRWCSILSEVVFEDYSVGNGYFNL